MKWENLREEEFKDAIKRSGGLCVMALGCLEKHGEHLPVGTDSLKGDKIVEIAAEEADVMMFPTTMWLGQVFSIFAIRASLSARTVLLLFSSGSIISRSPTARINKGYLKRSR